MININIFCDIAHFSRTKVTTVKAKGVGFRGKKNGKRIVNKTARRYNPKDEHLERSCRATEGDGFPCIGN